MPGSLSTEGEAVGWSRLATAAQLRSLAGCAAVGALAGLCMAHVRLHLGLPGHKALCWMIPVVVARLLYRHPVGATTGACAAACAAIALGGNLAGGFLFVPLVALAGGVLDGAAAVAERLRLSPRGLVALLGAAGAAANLLCALKRLLVPQGGLHVLWGLTGVAAQLVSYAVFGLLAGLAGAAIAAGVMAAMGKREGRRSGPDGR